MNNKATFLNETRKKMPFLSKFMENVDEIEKLHPKFCKVILGVHSKASKLAVYGELGMYPFVKNCPDNQLPL